MGSLRQESVDGFCLDADPKDEKRMKCAKDSLKSKFAEGTHAVGKVVMIGCRKKGN